MARIEKAIIWMTRDLAPLGSKNPITISTTKKNRAKD
jgi:hypothetical protein